MAFASAGTNGFLNSGREIQKFFMDMEYNTPAQESIRAVMDARPFNNVLLETDFEYGPGQLRKVKVSYYPQECDVVADACDNNVCEAGAVSSPVQQWYELTECIQSKQKRLYPADIRFIDGNWSFSTNAAQQIRAMMGAFRKELAMRITEKIIANSGLHLDGSEYGVRVNIVNTTDGLLTPIGITTIQQEFSNGAYMDPFLLGYTTVYNWRKFFGIATDNTYLGQNFRAIQAPRMYYDVNLNEIKGVEAGDPEYIIAFDPRALKFVTFSENAARWATTLMSPNDMDLMFKNGNDQRLLGVIGDPLTGLMYDFDVRYNPCVEGSKTGAYDWRLSLIWDILFPPVQTCNAVGVNGIMEYKTCPVVLPACPTGDVPSPSPSATDFSWTPGSIFPLLVSNITVGGRQNYPNALAANLAELAALMSAAYNVPGLFTVDGSDIVYSGFTALSGNINSNEIAITFA